LAFSRPGRRKDGSVSGNCTGSTLNDYLAAERTLLAWIPTGLALMGFGFVVARFGLFLQQLQIAQQPFSGSLTVWRCGLEPHSSEPV
jgi:hypothetical protein